MKRLPKIIKDGGYYLRLFRATYNFTQAEAAKFFHVGVSQWSLVESGRRNLSPRKAFEVAAVVEMPVELLLGVPVPQPLGGRPKKAAV